VHKVELAGEFGTLALAPGEMDAGAVWCTGALSEETERALLGIAGKDAAMGGEDQRRRSWNSSPSTPVSGWPPW
jgi:hypothetical protein